MNARSSKWIEGVVAALVLATALAFAPGLARAGDRLLRGRVEVAAPVAAVWEAFTTEAGVKTFFSPGAKIEPKVDGAYEIWFMPDAPEGERGGDFMRVLAFEPERRLAFTWNAPLSLPYTRAQRTMVVVELEPLGASRTRVTLTHLGWGEGKEWDATYDYFSRAWNVQVLPFLKYRFEHGPIDWAKADEVRAKVKPAVPDMKVELTARPVRSRRS